MFGKMNLDPHAKSILDRVKDPSNTNVEDVKGQNLKPC